MIIFAIDLLGAASCHVCIYVLHPSMVNITIAISSYVLHWRPWSFHPSMVNKTNAISSFVLHWRSLIISSDWCCRFSNFESRNHWSKFQPDRIIRKFEKLRKFEIRIADRINKLENVHWQLPFSWATVAAVLPVTQMNRKHHFPNDNNEILDRQK